MQHHTLNLYRQYVVYCQGINAPCITLASLLLLLLYNVSFSFRLVHVLVPALILMIMVQPFTKTSDVSYLCKTVVNIRKSNFRPYLTHQDPDERCKGTQLLALVLHRLSSFKLLEKEGTLGYM